MNKILGLIPFETHQLMSCSQIMSDLIKAYKFAFGDRLILSHQIKDELIKDAQDIVVLGPGNYWVAEIKNFLTTISEQGIRLNLHVYGNPMWHLDALVKMDRAGVRIPTRVFCASKESQRLGKALFKNQDVFHLPFPFTEPDQSIDQQTERKNFIYAGRIAHQKNSLQLLDIFKHYCDRYGRDDKFLIVGVVDHDFWPNNPSGNHLFYTASAFYKKIAELSQNGYPVEYLGIKPRDEVYNLLACAKAHISLSTYEGEDFSRITLEALSLGCPVIALKWNVFKDYENLLGIRLVEVNKNDDTLSFNEDVFLKYMESTSYFEKNDFSFLSYQKIAEKIQDIYQSSFEKTAEVSKLAKFYYQMNKKMGTIDKEFYKIYPEFYDPSFEGHL